MTALDLLAPAAIPSSRGRSEDRIRRAVRRERKEGLRLALQLRVAVMILVGAYLLTYGLEWRQVFNIAALTAICLNGWAQYRLAGTSYDRPPIMALFPLVDVLIVAWAVFLEADWLGLVPRTMLEEDRPFSWFLLLLTLQALAYRPWLAAWAGLITAAVWLGVLSWMLSYPGAYSDPYAGSGEPSGASHPALMAALYDPLFLQAEVWVREALIALVCGAILAVAAHRSQSLMARAVQAERSRANLARYFSPQMVDQLASQDQPFDRAREQHVGVLFADIVGFTGIAESLSPAEVIAFLREFHGRVARTVFVYDGTLDKFIGDSVMVTFGTPAAGREDATRTLACCHAIAEAVRVWSEERRTGGLAPVRVGIGAHYGPVVLGDIGDERRLEFAVLGDTVNVASRLEGLTRELGCTILASDDLVRAAQAEGREVDRLLAGFAPIAPQKLRNRDHPVAVWACPLETPRAKGQNASTPSL